MQQEPADYYVYVYIDPRNFQEFYYGKGQRRRKEAHLYDDGDSEKAAVIKAIRKAGLKPIIKVIAKGLTESEAFLVEKTLIWKLGHTLKNVATGHFADKFRPHNSFHEELYGFDYENGLFLVNVGEGNHRCWEDCKAFGFLSAGQDLKYSKPIRALIPGDIVVAYLKSHGYVGIGKALEKAVPILEFRYQDKLLGVEQLRQPGMFNNSENEKSEYVLKVQWIRAVEGSEAKWRSGLFTTRLIWASLQHQDATVTFLEQEFGIDLSAVLIDNEVV